MRKSRSVFSTFKKNVNGSFHFLDWSFAETFAESSIRTETKDQPKSEVIFRLNSLAETKLPTERSLNPKLINSPVDFAGTRLVNQLVIKF